MTPIIVVVFIVRILSFAHSFVVSANKIELDHLPEINGDKFYYFGYGSNMLTKRIHVQNPTAVKIGPGVLKDHRLDFNYYSTRWQGSAATVVEHANRTVQGTLWLIDLENLDDIDNQEGVHLNIYRPLSVSIVLLNKNETIPARVYVLVKQPINDFNDFPTDDVPFERQPSKTYLQCLVKGALESGVEAAYVEWLKAIKHNGRVADQLEKLLELQDVKLTS